MAGPGGSPPRPATGTPRDDGPPPSGGGPPAGTPRRGPTGSSTPKKVAVTPYLGAPSGAGGGPVRRAKDGHLGTGTDGENPTV